MPRKKQNDIEQPEFIAEEAEEYIISPDEEALREEYRRRLAEMLKNPEFRKIEGFPIGEDEAILALSDPPYYTACPNPFLNEIVEKWRSERAVLRDELGLPNDEPEGSRYIIRENMPSKNYHREPFAADVSEGKNDPIYNAHSYHTKVPHKAIMRYILHYTDPGDVVLDGFCGTGMTGVAAQLCGDKNTVESLGHTVKDGMVLDENRKPISHLGARKSVLTDLSPAATFIAHNYNVSVDTRALEREANRILKNVDENCAWMYETFHNDGATKGRIHYTVWGDIFVCAHCNKEINYWEVAVDLHKSELKKIILCPHCGTEQKKQELERAWVSVYDASSNKVVKKTKQQVVLIIYAVGKHRFEKKPDKSDLALIDSIEGKELPAFAPTVSMLFKGEQWGDTWRAGVHAGISSVNNFYTKRNLISLALMFKYVNEIQDKGIRDALKFLLTGSLEKISKRNGYRPQHRNNKSRELGGAMPGNLYIPTFSVELEPVSYWQSRISVIVKLYAALKANSKNNIVTTQSSSDIVVPNESVDYIFVDPPFGDNISYSELNFITESWLSVSTNNKKEAIISQTQKKSFIIYRDLMEDCFRKMWELLKPGRWMTVEFHNSQNAVWNAIQEALTISGFVVADVRSLSRNLGSLNQATYANAVKQDLIISAYKPTAEFEKRFQNEAGTSQGSWEFVRQHLDNLPQPNLNNGAIAPLQERMPYLLYDRMVAFHIQRGLAVPLSAPEFYQGLSQRFLEREGMVFTAAQAAAYDKLRLQAERVEQLALFVTDESSARQWLRQELENNPQTYGDLQPHFVQKLRQSKYEDLPELKILLEQSFIKDVQGKWHVPDLDNAAHLEQLRQSALLREFNEYRKSKGRLKVFRSEAVRAGFSHAWREREYDVIVEIAERIPDSVLQEDQQLVMYYHNAGLRQSNQPKQENLM